MGKGRRQEIGDRRQETGDNPPLAPPPPRRGEMGIIEEVGGRIIKGLFCATMGLKC
ncbi:hypothetical protein [Okeania sp. SIO1I7]|uniref:hypothetical protein n=1 Tax=Okeania sp. SIO1I7 TaxID=2607772 RepID=UPI0013FB490B|nr:hypothetical protein [Okeania sp. SIO1I7]NET28133.1 hypothetical protein [Okeania sp. SIO1I7]